MTTIIYSKHKLYTDDRVYDHSLSYIESDKYGSKHRFLETDLGTACYAMAADNYTDVTTTVVKTLIHSLVKNGIEKTSDVFAEFYKDKPRNKTPDEYDFKVIVMFPNSAYSISTFRHEEGDKPTITDISDYDFLAYGSGELIALSLYAVHKVDLSNIMLHVSKYDSCTSPVTYVVSQSDLKEKTANP